MKLVLSLILISSSISLLLIQSNSFSKAEITNNSLLTIEDGENALIGLSYGRNSLVTVTNNSGYSIEIDGIELLGHPDETIVDTDQIDSSLILPGGAKEITLTGNPEVLIGGVLKLNIRWDGGSAEIRSTIQAEIAE